MSFPGSIAIPTMPVMRPPVLKLIAPGLMLAKSFAGETTFAAMFTPRVATTTVNIATATSSRFSKRPTRSTGSQIASP